MKYQIKSFRGFVIQALVIAVITILLLEAVGLFVYFQKHGRLYYMDAGETTAAADSGATSEQTLETRTVLHPFLGFASRPSLPMSRVADTKRIREMLDGGQAEAPWTSLATNNHGFFSADSYPRDRNNQREFIIGVFGGSVAQWFALQGAELLQKKLRLHGYFRDRDITVLNYSQGGFKQPQQLQTLSYFMALGQEFDAIVNLDGFNEIALSHINHNNGIDTSMPSAQHLMPLLGLMSGAEVEMEMIDLLHGLGTAEKRLKRLERWEAETRSAGLHLVLSVLQDRARSEYAREVRAIDALGSSFKRTSLVHLAGMPNDLSISDSIAAAMELWLGAAVTMQELCNARGILYLEVIQPNQYSSGKAFTEQEREIAINMDSPYRTAIESGYRELPGLVDRMREEGVNVISAADVFDNVREQTYSDSCCHYNQLGNEILAEVVAESIIKLVENPQMTISGHPVAK